MRLIFIRVLAPVVVLSLVTLLKPPVWSQEPPQITFLEGHKKSVYAVGYAPDGRTFVTADLEGVAKVWDRATNKQIRSWQAHAGGVLCLAVAPDGLRVATGGFDKRVRLFDLPRWHSLADIAGLPAVPTSLSVSPDGKLALTGDASGLVRLWDTLAKQTVRDFPGTPGPVAGVAMLPETKTVLAIGSDGVLRGWNLDNAQPLGAIVTQPAGALAVHPERKLVALAGQDGVLRTYAWPPVPPIPMPNHVDAVTAVAISADGKLTASGGSDLTVPLVGADGKLLRGLVGQSGKVLALALSSDAATVATGSETGLLRFWQTADGKDLGTIAGPPVAITGLSLHPAEQVAAAAGVDGLVRIWSWPKAPRALAGHTQLVSAVAVSPDGKTAATASPDKTVKVWNVAEGKLLRTIDKLAQPAQSLAFSADGAHLAFGDAGGMLHTQFAIDGAGASSIRSQKTAVTAVAFDKNGKTLLSCGADGSARLWNIPLSSLEKPAENELAKPQIEVAADTVKIYDAQFLPDGSGFVTAGEDKLVKLWDLSGKLVRQYAGSGTAVRSVSVSADGTQMAAGGDPLAAQTNVFLWRTSDAGLVHNITTPAGVIGVALSSDGKIAVAGADKHLRFYSTTDGKLLHDIPAPAVLQDLAFAGAKTVAAAGADNAAHLFDYALVQAIGPHAAGATSVVYMPDGKRLITAGADKLVKMWSLPGGQPLASLTGRAGAISQLAISRDGKRLFAACADNTARTWELPPADAAPPTEIPVKASLAHPALVRGVSANEDGSRLATACDDGLVRLWDVAIGKELERFPGHAGAVSAVAVSAEGTAIVSGGVDKTLRRWTPAVRVAAGRHAGPIHAAAYSSDGQQLFTAGADKQIAAWRSVDLALVRKFEGATAPVKSLSVSSDGKYLAAGGDDLQARLWTTADGALAASTALPAAITSVVLNSDGNQLVVSCADNIVRNFHLTQIDGKHALVLTHELQGHTAPVARIALSSDARVLISAGNDQTVRRWHLASVAPRFDLDQAAGPLYGLAFSTDGKQLAAASGDKVARVYNAESGELAVELKGHVGQVFAVSIHPNGKSYATGSLDNTIRLWDAAGMQTHEIKEGVDGRVQSLFFSADGNTLFSAGGGKQWQARAVADQKLLRSSLGHNHAIYTARLSPAGNRLATLDYSGKLFIWDAASAAPLYHQQLPVSAGYALAYAPDGTELLVGTSDPRAMRVVVPPPAR